MNKFKNIFELLSFELLLLIYLVGFTFIVFIEILNFFFCFFPFLSLSVTYGTIGATLIALMNPLLLENRKRQNKANQLLQNLKNEILINFDILHHNATIRNSFQLYLFQLKALLKNSEHVNLEAEGVTRNLINLYQSEESLNKLLKSPDLSVPGLWITIKADIIKNMLITFEVCGRLSSGKKSLNEKSLILINNFLGFSVTRESIERLGSTLDSSFWDLTQRQILDEFPELVDLGELDYHGLIEQIPSINQEDGRKKEIILNYLIHIIKLKYHHDKDIPIKGFKASLENELRKLINH